MKRHETSCGAVVFRKTAEGPVFLLIRHVNGGHWAFPKGHMEPGESEEETALREIREETGLPVRLDTGFCRTVRYTPKPGVEKDVVYFLASPDPGGDPAQATPQEGEIRELRWLPGEEALPLVTYDNDRQVLKEAAVYIGRTRKA